MSMVTSGRPEHVAPPEIVCILLLLFLCCCQCIHSSFWPFPPHWFLVVVWGFTDPGACIGCMRTVLRCGGGRQVRPKVCICLLCVSCV